MRLLSRPFPDKRSLCSDWQLMNCSSKKTLLGADVTQPPIKVSTWHVMYCLLFLVAQPLDRLSFVNLALFFLYSYCLSLSANFSFLSFSTIENNPPPTIPTWLHFLLMDCVIRWWLKAQRIPAARESELGWRVFFLLRGLSFFFLSVYLWLLISWIWILESEMTKYQSIEKRWVIVWNYFHISYSF